MVYGETMNGDVRGEIELKILGVTHPAVSTGMTLVMRIRRRNDTMNAGIGIPAATVDAMINSYMSMIGAARRIGGEVDHGIDLDRARHEQTENLISVIIGYTAQPDPHPQPWRAMGTIALHRE